MINWIFRFVFFTWWQILVEIYENQNVLRYLFLLLVVVYHGMVLDIQSFWKLRTDILVEYCLKKCDLNMILTQNDFDLMLYFRWPNTFHKHSVMQGVAKSRVISIFAQKSIFPYFQTASCENSLILLKCYSIHVNLHLSKFWKNVGMGACSKTVKFGQFPQARNLVSQGGIFRQLSTWIPTP